MSQLSRRALSILSKEGIAGLGHRVASRLVRKPLLVNLRVLALDYRDARPLPPPNIALQMTRVTEADDGDLEALAALHFYGHSKADILQYLQAGQQCYAAKHEGRVISCYWRVTGEHHDYYLNRRFFLADNEEYLLGVATLGEFRGMGIFPYLLVASSHERFLDCPSLRAVAFVRANNRSSLRSFLKVGFRTVGRVGCIEAFGIRLHFLFGRDALPKTSKRVFLAFLGSQQS